MKVLFVTDGSKFHPSTRIRVLQYLPYLTFDNINFHIHYRVLNFGPGTLNSIIFFITKRFLRLSLFFKILFYIYDIIFIQRTIISSLELKIIKYRKKKLIYDIDDGIFLYNLSYRNGFFKMTSAANKILVSTPFLKYYLEKDQKKAELVYSSVDSTKFFGTLDMPKNKVIIGWSGSSSTLKYVASILNDILEILHNFNFVEFHYISAHDELSRFHERIFFHKWSEKLEPEIIRNFDIGIMPLEYNEWEKYKGGYKIFMYLMSDVPVLASSIGINQLIIGNGKTGFLIKDKSEWARYLHLLCSQPNILKNLKTQVNLMDKSYFNLRTNYFILKNCMENG